jgi:hypothetical protein
MDEHLTHQKALQDLSTIRNAIDRATGAEIFTNFIYSTGTLMAVSGLVIVINCIVNYYILSTLGLTATTKKAMIIMWVSVLCLIGTVTLFMFAVQGKKHDMGFISYYRHIANKAFLQIDIPLEIMTTIFIILFIKIGRYEFIIPTCAIWIAVLFTSLGTVYVEKSFTFVGYIFLVCSAVGLLFMSHLQPLFVACVFGILPVILGLIMHGRYKQLKEAHVSEHASFHTSPETNSSEE